MCRAGDVIERCVFAKQKRLLGKFSPTKRMPSSNISMEAKITSEEKARTLSNACKIEQDFENGIFDYENAMQVYEQLSYIYCRFLESRQMHRIFHMIYNWEWVRESGGFFLSLDGSSSPEAKDKKKLLAIRATHVARLSDEEKKYLDQISRRHTIVNKLLFLSSHCWITVEMSRQIRDARKASTEREASSKVLTPILRRNIRDLENVYYYATRRDSDHPDVIRAFDEFKKEFLVE